MRRAGSTRAGAEEPVQEPDEFRRRYRNAIDTDMADIHDEEHSTPKKRAKKMMYNLGVAEVNGKGVCCFLDRDTSYDGLGFVNCVLRCRDAQSGFFVKLYGFRKCKDSHCALAMTCIAATEPRPKLLL